MIRTIDCNTITLWIFSIFISKYVFLYSICTATNLLLSFNLFPHYALSWYFFYFYLFLFSGFSLTEVQKKQAMLNACKSHTAGKPKGMHQRVQRGKNNWLPLIYVVIEYSTPQIIFHLRVKSDVRWFLFLSTWTWVTLLCLIYYIP